MGGSSPLFEMGTSRSAMKASLIMLGTVASLLTACDAPAEPYISYQPLGLPVTFVMTTTGIEVEAGWSVVTPIGVFGLGAKFPVSSQQPGDMILILRDLAAGKDTIYRIQGGESATIVADGRVVVQVSPSEVIVDITNAHTIQVNPPPPGALRRAPPARSSLIPSADCPGAFPSRLTAGTTAHIVPFQVKVYTWPGSSFPLAEHKYLREGRTVTIIGGPICSGGMVWWEVDSGVITLSNGRRDNVRGWVPEESGGDWMLSP